MSQEADKRTIAIVTACMRRDGLPDFALNHVEVTQEQLENGIHYYLVEAILLESGFEEPFTHFDETEAPSFLHPAVREYLSHRNPTDQEPALAETT